MNELSAALKIALANTFVMYFKAHSYHWNVEGSDFSEYHSFFGDLYDELYDAIDPIAERIRTLDVYAPVSLVDLLAAATIAEDTTAPVTGRAMMSSLAQSNAEVIGSLNKSFEYAQASNNQGVMNYIADRLDMHAKHGWMIRSFLKNNGAQ